RDSIRPRVIYGEDDRLDIYEVEDPALTHLAASTAAMVRERMLTLNEIDGTFQLETQNFGERYRLCEDEPFRNQRTGAVCSAFLVSPNVLVTAGHCVRTQGSCETARFVFDYALFESEQEQPHQGIPAANVYSCKNLIHSEVQVNSADFAVIELDRPVTGRTPLQLNLESSIDLGANILVIGHPVGLPTKVAGGASVRHIEEAYFIANLDTYGGNSGSAVFNAETGEVEGILVRGARDFVEKDGCRASNRCADDACGGEDVTKIQYVEPYL
ncbi:MAG: serine protease, partial [Pseudomonadota bacterium]